MPKIGSIRIATNMSEALLQHWLTDGKCRGWVEVHFNWQSLSCREPQ